MATKASNDMATCLFLRSPHICAIVPEAEKAENIVGMPSDRKSEFERMRARHQMEIDRQLKEVEARKELDERMAALRAGMEAAREEFEQAVGKGVEALTAARKYRDKFGVWPELKGRKRRPRGGFDGGEPVPVMPRPKPTPLVDGAEAPIE